MSQKTILYVEDNEFNRKIVKQLLAPTKYRLREAPDGEAGLRMAHEEAPDLIDALSVILARHNVAPVAFDEARTMIGAGVKPLLQRALASKGKQCPAEEIDRLFAEYLEIYAAHIADRSRPCCVSQFWQPRPAEPRRSHALPMRPRRGLRRHRRLASPQTS